MASDSKMIRDIESKLEKLNLSPDEKAKRRKAAYKLMAIEPDGWHDSEVALNEGAWMIGVIEGDLRQTIASKGLLWIGDKSFTSMSGAAAEATGRPTQSGKSFWRIVFRPGKGFVELEKLIEEQRLEE